MNNNQENKYNNESGQTFPLYDIVKYNIYMEFEEMKRAYSEIIINPNTTSRTMNILKFNQCFLRFFIELDTDIKTKRLQKKDLEKLRYLYDNVSLKKNFTLEEFKFIVSCCRVWIEELGITKIEGKIKDGFAF